MKNKKGSTLMIVMMVFTLFAFLSAALSTLFFVTLKQRLNRIEERALFLELKNDFYKYLNFFDGALHGPLRHRLRFHSDAGPDECNRQTGLGWFI